MNATGPALLRVCSGENSEATQEWRRRWISLKNGVITWYVSEFEYSPDGVAILSQSIIPSDTTLDNGEQVLTVRAETAEGNIFLELAFAPEEYDCWCTVFDRQSGCGGIREFSKIRTKHVSQLLELSELENSSLVPMVLNVNGQQETLQIAHNEDIELCLNNILHSKNLKPELKQPIETELLRTKLEACQLFIGNLKLHVATLNRRAFDVIIAEERAAIAEDHVSELTVSLGNVELVLPQIRIAIDDAKTRIQEKDNQLNTLYQYLSVEQRNQQHLETMVFDSANKLMDAERLMESVTQENAGLKSRLTAMKASLLSNNNSSSANTNKGRDDQQSTAESLVSSVNSRIHPEVRELRHQKAALAKQLSIAEELLRQSQQEMAMLIGAKAAQRRMGNFTDTLQFSEEDLPVQVSQRIRKLEEKLKSSKQMLHFSEEGNRTLQVENDQLQEAVNVLTGQLHQAEEELHLIAGKRRDLTYVQMENLLRERTGENDKLKEQVLTLRGEVLRLQANVEEIKNSAAKAVQSLQILSPNVNLWQMVNQISESQRTQQQDPGKNGRMEEALGATPESVRDDGEPATDHEYNLLTPTIVNRVYSAIYTRYVPEGSMAMNLTRFVRFAKDFGIVDYNVGNDYTISGPFLVGGEVDIIFLNSAKLSPLTENEALQRGGSKKAFVVGKRGGITPKKTLEMSPQQEAVPTLSPSQFAAAVKQLACKLYSIAVERQTGFDLECLPPREREEADEKALQLLLKRKIFPVAEKLDLIPWALIHLEHAIDGLRENTDHAATRLEMHLPVILQWFGHYATIDAAAGSQFAAPSPQRPSVFSRISLSYKNISKFSHDYGVVPYLMKESDLFKLFLEVVLACRETPLVLLENLSPSVKNSGLALRELGGVMFDTNDWCAPFHNHFFVVDKTVNSDKLGLAGFCYFLLTSAVKSFPTLSVSGCIDKLVSLCGSSGGLERSTNGGLH